MSTQTTVYYIRWTYFQASRVGKTLMYMHMAVHAISNHVVDECVMWHVCK